MVKFNFIKRLEVSNNSIFYSFILFENEILGFGRRNILNCHERTIKHIKINKVFDIVEDKNIYFKGEDPRCFEYNNSIFVLDNTYNDMHLLNYNKNLYLKILIDGKNISFINHNNKVYFIHFMKPFVLYELNMRNGKAVKIDVDVDHNCECNNEYRGGTSGFKIRDNIYIGFGHRTYVSNNILKHDIYKWEINFDNKPKLSIIDVDQPIYSKNICDPTSILNVNNKLYLFTAETDLPWFFDQDYINNVYEIIEE